MSVIITVNPANYWMQAKNSTVKVAGRVSLGSGTFTVHAVRVRFPYWPEKSDWQDAGVAGDRWSYEAEFPAEGTYTMVVWAKGRRYREKGDDVYMSPDEEAEITTTIWVGIDAQPPVLTILDGQYTGPGPRVRVVLRGSAKDERSGVSVVEYALAGGEYQAATGTEPWIADCGDLPFGEYQVTVRATDQVRRSTSRTVTVAVTDNAGPQLSVTRPDDGLHETAEDGHVRVTVSGSATDPSGVATVEVGVGDGTPAPAMTSDSWQHWTRPVDLDPGEHTIRIRAVDTAGNATEVTRSVSVHDPVTFTAVDRQAYLRELLSFANRNIVTREAGPATTTGRLTEVLRQPLELLARGDRGYARQPVRMLRAVLEVVARLLRPTPAAPLAHWPLDETGGEIAHDATGGGSPARVVFGGGGWSDDTDNVGLCCDGEQTRATMPRTPRLVFSSAATISLWIRPTGAVTDPAGVAVLQKDGEYGVGVLAGGLVQWAFSQEVKAAGAPRREWVWHSTKQTIVPTDAWTHLTVVYDQGVVRTYLNGTYVEKASAGGTAIVAADGELSIGRPAVAGARKSFTGLVRDVALFDRALTPWQVRCSYAPDSRHAEVLWVSGRAIDAASVSPTPEAWNWTKSPRGARAPKCHVTNGDRHGFFLLPVKWRSINRGDRLFAYVMPDPAKPPTSITIELFGDRYARPRWGGPDGPDRVGAAPAPGVWTRLEVPASRLGLEESLVSGMTFASEGGTVVWDTCGVAPWETTEPVRQAFYRTYAALVQGTGTSVDELREARGAPDERRRALAARLGFDLTRFDRPVTPPWIVGRPEIVARPGPAAGRWSRRPDQLDRLLLAPDQVSEGELEELFGFPPIGTASAVAGSEPLILVWRRAKLRDRWRRQDHPSGSGVPLRDLAAPVVEPEVVTADDIAEHGSTGLWPLWLARRAVLEAELADVVADRDPSDPVKALDTTLQRTVPDLDLTSLAARDETGEDIDGSLAAVGLSLAAFHRLLAMRALAASDALLPAEWSELDDIVRRILALRHYAAWHAEERSSDIVAEPAHFVAEPHPAPAVSPWRCPDELRARFVGVLRDRREQLRALADAVDSAVGEAEAVTLPDLRDALVEALADGAAGTEPAVDFVDLDTSVGPVTTRLDLAVEAVQALLLDARADSLDRHGSATAGWALASRENGVPNLAAFDAAWTWLASYDSWASAASVLLHPENLLLPALLPAAPSGADAVADRFALGRVSNGFSALCNRLGTGELSPSAVAEAIATYQEYLVGLAEPVKPGTSPTQLQKLASALTQHRFTIGGLSRRDIEQRRQQADAIVGAQSLPDAPTWAVEVFLLIPLYVAGALQQQAQYLVALDWYRAVCDDGTVEGRYGLVGFDVVPPSQPVTRDPGWLEKALNPHQFAADRPVLYARFALVGIVRCLLDYADDQFTRDTPGSRAIARELYEDAQQRLDALRNRPGLGGVSPKQSATFPPDPLLAALAQRADTNLRKLHDGRNMAGLPRPLDPADDDVPTGTGAAWLPSRPTVGEPMPYRYVTLVQRARDLAGSAAQVEGAYLATLEKEDVARYDLLKAGHDVDVAGLRVTVAQALTAAAAQEVELMDRQRERAVVQRNTYQQWLAAGRNHYEQCMLDSYESIRDWKILAGAAEWNQGVLHNLSDASLSNLGKGGKASWIQLALAAGSDVFGAVGKLFSGGEANAEQRAQTNALLASIERREDEWRLQFALAGQDTAIAEQQKSVALSRHAAAVAETNIANAEHQHTRDVLTFLCTKFTNLELYEWMSGELRRVYRYLLQQATALGRMAERQLAVERQEPVPAFIQGDYWSGGHGRQGLTGSARLLADLTALDQHAFLTNTRRLQLTHTMSLAEAMPAEFAQFRRTGVLTFATPMSLFDRAFPGHYGRLIRRVRVSVVGLIPPVHGIRATLFANGLSRVVVNDGGYHVRVLRHSPQTIAFTAPMNAAGLFELDAQAELLPPFEGMGVDTVWRLELPRSSNMFDFRTLADVIVSIDYTALHSDAYARQVLQSLPDRLTCEQALHLRDDYPDRWYDLMNPPDGATAVSVRLPVRPEHFPPNLSNRAIRHVALYVVTRERMPEQLRVSSLVRELAGGSVNGGAAKAVAGVISTRNGSGAAWLPLTDAGTDPVGDWILTCAADPDGRMVLEQLDDLVLVITYDATVPPPIR